MDQQSEAENRALDARCRLPTSSASRTAVIKLRALSPDRQAFCIASYAQFDLPHLVRCALEAVCHRCAVWELCVRLTPGRRSLRTGHLSRHALGRERHASTVPRRPEGQRTSAEGAAGRAREPRAH
jgi:hypothetical protein